MARTFADASLQALYNSTWTSAVSYSLSIWVRATGFGTVLASAIAQWNQATQGNFWIRADTATQVLQYFHTQSDNTPKGVVDTVALSTNTWYHACATADGSNLNLYKNATAVAAATAYDGTVQATAQVGIGGRISTTNTFHDHGWDGQLAEAAIWRDVALSQAEISALAAGYSPLFIRPASLWSYWPIIGRASPEIDRVGGRTMTLLGTPANAAHPRIIMPRSTKMRRISAGVDTRKVGITGLPSVEC